MANETTIIDVIARFKDNVTDGTKKAKKSVADFEKTVDNIGKKKTSVRIDADTKKAKRSVTDLFKSVTNLSKKKNSVRIDADTKKATTGIKKLMSSAGAFAKKSFKSTLNFIDKASPMVEKAIGKARSFASRVWKSTLSVVDKFTSPLTKLKNMLFNINTLIAAVGTGLATKLIVAEPISIADEMTTAEIFFETKLGSKKAASSMISDIKDFAVETPFETGDIVKYTQSMLAMGFEADSVLSTLNSIGNTSAALGKGSDGIDSVVRALGQMQMKGKVSAEEMLQLTEAGVAGWDYIAKGVGKTTAEVQEMVSKGLIPVDDAIGYIIKGMDEYDGMMQKTANKTVSGLFSQIKDTFSIAIVEKWGRGLQKGAVGGLEKFNEFLGRIDDKLQSAGTGLESFGESISTKVFSTIEGITTRFEKVLDSDAFKNADLGGKIKIVWNDVIWEPFSTWWEKEGKAKVAKKMEEFGGSLGTGISNGLLALLGVDAEGALNEGASIGASFAEGFAEGFDGEAVGEALWNALKKGIGSGSKGLTDLLLPGDQGATGGQKLVGLGLGYAGLKMAPTLFKAGKGIFKFGKGTFDAFSVLKGTKTVADVSKGSATAANILGKLGSGASKILKPVGTFLKPYAIAGTGLLKGGLGKAGATLTGGLGKVAGKVAPWLSILDFVVDGFSGYKDAKKSGASTKQAVGKGVAKSFLGNYEADGTWGRIGSAAGNTLKYAGVGAAIGSVVPGAGTAIGAGVGAAVGLISNLIAQFWDPISNFFTETLPEKWDEFWTGVGEFFEGLGEWASVLWDKTVVFFTETLPEKWSEFWKGVGEFFTETIPYAIGYVAGKITVFFTETLPEKWDEFWKGVGEFFEELGEWASVLWDKTVVFFTETLPEKWDEFWSAVGNFFTETLPTWAEDVWNNNIVPFFTEDIPEFFVGLWNSLTTFFTETLPTWASDVWNNNIVPFFTEDIPQFFSDIWDSVTSFFTESLPRIASEIWGSIKGWFSSVKDWFSSVWENVKGSFSAGYGAATGGGAANNATGGFVKGRTLSWLAEEGYPETVIPLAPHRRGRAVSLWERTGELLGMKPEYNALGGIVGSNISETPSRDAPLASYRIGRPGSVQISIGNITFEIKSGDNPTDILAAIKAQKAAIVEVVSEALYEALLSQFDNTPLAAG